MARSWQMLLADTLTISTAFIYPTKEALAQNITTDGTVGTPKTLTGPNYNIPQSLGQTVNSNLFHSFGKFNLDSNEAAIFQSGNEINNIFSRVTGGSPSSINGLIRTLGQDVNLFFLNPNGIIFGENASLDVSGSFLATTADSFVFGDGLEFSATNPQAAPILIINMPIGLGLGDNPGEIVNRSFVQNSAGDFAGLEVAPGENLTLVGGNINFEIGRVTARGGNIQLGGLSEAGIVDINDNSSLKFPEDVARADITLSNAANVDVRGTGGGSITINARNLSLEVGKFGFSGISAGITADSTSANARAGNITINVTDRIAVDEGVVGNQVSPNGIGNAGNIMITTGSLSITNGGTIDASTQGQGNAGLIIINANDNIQVDGEDSNGFSSNIGSQVVSMGEGNGGNVIITTGSFSLTNGGNIVTSTRNNGDAGSINITATNTISIDGEDSRGRPSGIASQALSTVEGDAGQIIITTDSLSLTNGGAVSSSTFGQGNAGSVEITADDTILIDGVTSRGFTSSVSSQVSKGGVGNGGSVAITTGSLNVTKGGEVSTSTFGQGNAGSVEITANDTILIDGENPNGFSSSVISTVGLEAIGNAGGISISTNSLSLTNGGTISTSTFSQGNAGSVEITANDTILIDGENSNGFSSSFVSQVNPQAEGDAGGVNVTTDTLSLTNGGQISATTAGQGNAGDVTINATKSITISGVTENNLSGLSAKALISNGNGGDVNVLTNQLTIDDGGTIEAGNLDRLGVFNPGTGEPGDINIKANSLSLSNEARIDAVTQSETGNNANINLQIADNIILRNNSFISAQALERANGGNLTIDTNFIIAFPNQNNDIIANAQQGSGGKIDIVAESLFGIKERPLNDITNDINASSDVGLDGDISINTPDVDPIRGLTKLPANVIDASQQITQGCTPQESGQFVSTGRGGLPLSPNEPLRGTAVITNWVDEPTETTGKVNNQLTRNLAEDKSNSKIIEAQRWIINDRGNVELVTEPPANPTIPINVPCNR